jgi:hypothetical protein
VYSLSHGGKAALCVDSVLRWGGDVTQVFVCVRACVCVCVYVCVCVCVYVRV